MGMFVSVKCRSESKFFFINVVFVGFVFGMFIDMCLEVFFLIEVFVVVFVFVYLNSGMSFYVVF